MPKIISQRQEASGFNGTRNEVCATDVATLFSIVVPNTAEETVIESITQLKAYMLGIEGLSEVNKRKIEDYFKFTEMKNHLRYSDEQIAIVKLKLSGIQQSPGLVAIKPYLIDALTDVRCFPDHEQQLNTLLIRLLFGSDAICNKFQLNLYERMEGLVKAYLHLINRRLFTGLVDPQTTHQKAVFLYALDKISTIADGTLHEDPFIQLTEVTKKVYAGVVGDTLTVGPLLRMDDEPQCIQIMNALISPAWGRLNPLELNESGFVSYLSTRSDVCKADVTALQTFLAQKCRDQDGEGDEGELALAWLQYNEKTYEFSFSRRFVTYMLGFIKHRNSGLFKKRDHDEGVVIEDPYSNPLPSSHGVDEGIEAEGVVVAPQDMPIEDQIAQTLITYVSSDTERNCMTIDLNLIEAFMGSTEVDKDQIFSKFGVRLRTVLMAHINPAQAINMMRTAILKEWIVVDSPHTQQLFQIMCGCNFNALQRLSSDPLTKEFIKQAFQSSHSLFLGDGVKLIKKELFLRLLSCFDLTVQELVQIKDDYGSTVLHWLAQHHADTLLTLILEEGLPLDKLKTTLDGDGNNVFPWLVFHRQWDFFKPLIVRNLITTEMLEACSETGLNKGKNTLWWLANWKQSELIRSLIENSLITKEMLKACSETGPNKGINTLWWLANWEQWGLIQTLIDNYPITTDMLEACPETGPNKGINVLWWLANWEQSEIIKSLIDKTLITKEMLEACSEEGLYKGTNTLWWLAINKQYNLIRSLIVNSLITKEMLEACPEEGLNKGKNVLWCLANWEQSEIIKSLIDKTLITTEMLEALKGLY